MSYRIGLDLGGTFIKGGLLDDAANIVAQQSLPTEADEGPSHVMDRMAELARLVVEAAGVSLSEIEAVGVGTPGPTDKDDAVVIAAPNLRGWVNVPLRDELRERIGLPVRVFNDANAACYGEYLAGAASGTGVTDMILLTLGTGVGGGVVTKGRLFAGAHNAGAELGHMILEVNGRPCGCGQRGCLEQYASATAVASDARRLMAENGSTNLPAEPTSKDVFEAAGSGDRVAEQVLDHFALHLGVACVNLVRIFDPQMIVLGGGVVAAGDSLTNRVRRVFDEHTWKLREEQVQIALATRGNDAGFIGAAGLAAAAEKEMA